MSGPNLPDDPRDWPTDPFALFGVPHDVDDKTLRRAYTALIRRYKPEQAPDAFQKIREAYEELQERIKWAGWQRARSADETEEESGEVPPAPLPDLRLPPDPAEEIRAAWGQAREGRWADAYRDLTRLAQHVPDSEEIAQRLLWLRRLRPELASGGPPDAASFPRTHAQQIDFLERMRKSYRTAYSEAAERWWTAPLSGWVRLRFVQARWTAAAEDGAFFRIGADLGPARRMFAEDRPRWFQTLVLAQELSYLSVREEGMALRQAARDLLREERDLELQFSHVLDRLDLLRDSSDRLALPTGGEDPLALLAIRGGILEGEFQTWRQVGEVVLGWTRDPDQAVRDIDRIGYSLRHVLLRVIQQYAGERGLDFDPPDPVWLGERVDAAVVLVKHFQRYMSSRPSYDFEPVSRQLTAFCLRERILLDHVLGELNRKFGRGNAEYATHCRTIAGDPALASVVIGCLGFWSTGTGSAEPGHGRD